MGDNKRTWKSCFSVDGVHLPTGYFFGVSAATGDLSDNHDVTGLKTYELDTPESKDERADILPNADVATAPRDHTEDPPPGMSGVKILPLHTRSNRCRGLYCSGIDDLQE